MEHEEQAEETYTWEINEEELTQLIAAIDREQLNNHLTKHASYFQHHLFRGSRPEQLPPQQWQQVPRKLAHDAISTPAKINHLVVMWAESNKLLIDEVNAIAPENIREGTEELLGRLGLDQKFQVLFALRISDREDIQQALADGLAEEIIDESSDLFAHVRNAITVTSLVTAQAEIAKLQEQLNEMRSKQKVSEHKSKQTQERLQSIQVENAELRQSVTDLRATLQTQIKMRTSKQEEIHQQFDQKLLQLEDERKKTAQLRQRLARAEQNLEDAYAKRDEAEAQSEVLREQLKKAEHDKDVIIEEKRKLQESKTGLSHDLDEARRQLHEQTTRPTIELSSLSELEARWQEEREAIRDFLRATINTLAAPSEFSVRPIDKSALWAQWQNRETALVQDALKHLEQDISQETLEHIQKAQQLLALRWYVLEYTRQVALARLQESAFPL